MVDGLKSLGFECVFSNPGSSFRALHESVVNYGGNKAPEFITCCHEESSVAMAHGYAKIEGKPACVFAHGTVGLQQHASMALYMGVYGEGPMTDPKDLGPAIKRALDVVAKGEPAMVDVVTQPR